jgi:hypothetical protein
MEDEGAVWRVRGGNDNLWPKSVKALDRMMEFPAHPDRIDSRREIDRTVTALAAGSLPSVDLRPWQRDSSQFRHPDIMSWVKNNRGELIWSALTLAKAWIVAGCPEPKGIKLLGGFEEYSSVIGGILQIVGIKGFLGNADEFYESSDSEGAELRLFVSKWWESFEGKPVGVSELFDLINESDIQIDLGNPVLRSGQDNNPVSMDKC